MLSVSELLAEAKRLGVRIVPLNHRDIRYYKRLPKSEMKDSLEITLDYVLRLRLKKVPFIFFTKRASGPDTLFSILSNKILKLCFDKELHVPFNCRTLIHTAHHHTPSIFSEVRVITSADYIRIPVTNTINKLVKVDVSRKPICVLTSKTNSSTSHMVCYTQRDLNLAKLRYGKEKNLCVSIVESNDQTDFENIEALFRNFCGDASMFSPTLPNSGDGNIKSMRWCVQYYFSRSRRELFKVLIQHSVLFD